MSASPRYPADITIADVVVREIVDRIIKVNDLAPADRRGIINGLAVEMDVPIAFAPSSSAGWPEIVEHHGDALVEAVEAGLNGWDHRQREIAAEAERVAGRLMELVEEWLGAGQT